MLTDLKSKEDLLEKELIRTEISSDDFIEFQLGLSPVSLSINENLSASKDPLSYFLALLRNEQPILPQGTVELWSAQLDHLNNYEIIPLLYWKIGLLPPDLQPPKDIANQMRETFLGSHGRYLLMEEQLRQILAAFEHEGIEALVLKGPALALTAYPHPATRPFADIDLLVRPHQYAKAREVLYEVGYRCQLDRFESLQELFNAEPFVHSDHSQKYIEVDLHWGLFQYHGLSRNSGLDEIFRTKTKAEITTLEFGTLDRVNALLYTAFHLVIQHSKDMRLTWIGDIALLAQSLVCPDEWEALRQRCSALKLNLAMKEALRLAQIWYGLQIPRGYNDLTKWLDPEEDEKAELTYLLQKEGPDIRLKGYFGNFLSAPKKIQFLLKFLFPSPEYICMTFPPSKRWLLPLSYIRRWGSWIGKVFQYGVHELKQFKS